MSSKQKKGGNSSKGVANSLFDFEGDRNDYVQNASVGDEDANFASPTSSQFVHREKKAATGTKGSSALAKKHMGKGL